MQFTLKLHNLNVNICLNYFSFFTSIFFPYKETPQTNVNLSGGNSIKISEEATFEQPLSYF